jgi:single-strand DNA-binding protein
LAEIAGEYVKKGRPVYVEGRLKYGKYTDKDGIEKNTVDIIATELQLLGGREGAGAASGLGHEEGSASRPTQSTSAQRPDSNSKTAPKTGFDDMDDDIPF